MVLINIIVCWLLVNKVDLPVLVLVVPVVGRHDVDVVLSDSSFDGEALAAERVIDDLVTVDDPLLTRVSAVRHHPEVVVGALRSTRNSVYTDVCLINSSIYLFICTLVHTIK